MSRPASMRLAMAISPSRLQQFDGTHFPQVHPHRVIGAVGRLGDLFGDIATVGPLFAINGGDIFVWLGVLAVFARFVVLDNVDAHFVERGHDVLDLLAGHLILRQRGVELINSDIPALLRAG